MQDGVLSKAFYGEAIVGQVEQPAAHAVSAQASADSALGLRADRALNYVWINKVPDQDLPPDDTAPLCSVPLQYLNKAYENARKYPDTEVRVWIDEARLCDRTRFFVQSHAYLNAPANVRFKDLNSVPAYRAAQDIYADKGVSLWDKVDLARFQVVAQCLSEQKIETAYYADFDVRDAALDSMETKNILARRDIAFARLPGEDLLSHGYFAVRKEGRAFIEKLVSKFEDAVRHGGHVFPTLHAGLPFPYHFSLRRRFTDIDIPSQGLKMPCPPLYGRETGLCGFEFR